MSFIGQPAPDFTAPAVMPDGQFLPEFHLHDFAKDKNHGYLLLFDGFFLYLPNRTGGVE